MNGYRRGAYENMTKDMNNEEKNSNVMHNVKSSDWLSQNFGVRFRYNALEISIRKISFQAKIVLVLLKVYNQFRCTQVQH